MTSAPRKRRNRAMSGSEKQRPTTTTPGSGVVVPITDTHAVVLDRNQPLAGVGRVQAILPEQALAQIIATAKITESAIVGTGKLTGRLVELDSTTAQLLKHAKQTTEPGGWIQGTLRQDGRYVHVARFRPANAASITTGAANIVGALAAQAQLAAIHRDVLRTLKSVQAVAAFQKDALTGKVAADVGIVTECMEIISTSREPNERAAARARMASDRLRASSTEALKHAQTRAQQMSEEVRTRPTKARKFFEQGAADDLHLYLTLAAVAHQAWVLAAALEVAVLTEAADRNAAAHQRSLDTTVKREKRLLRAVADDAEGTLTALEQSFMPARARAVRNFRKALDFGAASGAATASLSAARLLAAPAMIPLITGQAALAAGVGVHAKLQERAQQAMQPHITELLQASRQLSNIDEVTRPGLHLLEQFHADPASARA